MASNMNVLRLLKLNTFTRSLHVVCVSLHVICVSLHVALQTNTNSWFSSLYCKHDLTLLIHGSPPGSPPSSPSYILLHVDLH